MRPWLDKISNSPSASLLVWVGSFIAGIVAVTVFAPASYAAWAQPAMFGCFLFALASGFILKDKNTRMLTVAACLIFAGVARYLSSRGDVVDLLKYFPALAATKAWLIAAVGRMLPEPHAGFLDGLLVGGGAGSPALKAAFVATGTAHVMALSGWNISSIGKWVNSIFMFFRLQKMTRLVATTVAVIAFVIMTGVGASLVRAAVMAVFANVAFASGRPSAQGRAVSYAAALMLLVSPRVMATDVGFLLSVAGCLGMVYLSPFFAPFVKFLPDRYDLRGTVAGTLAATLATLPVALAAFGQFSLVALPTNVLLLPFVAPTMLVGFLGAIVSSIISPLTAFCGAITLFFTNYDISVVKLFARVPGASIAGVSFNLTAAALMTAGMVWMTLKHYDDLHQKEN